LRTETQYHEHQLTSPSLSEYGCNKNTRTFGAVKSLYDSDMTSVYSISGDTYTENPDFQALMQQFSENPAPSGDGGYKSDGTASPCPSNSDTWNVKDFNGEDLPALPDGASDYMKNGAGKGPGLTGDGSQNAGGQSTATASAGSGSVTAVASNAASSGASSSGATAATSSAAASSLLVGDMGKAPFVCGAVVLISTLFGAALL
jgi:hypothetical protein